VCLEPDGCNLCHDVVTATSQPFTPGEMSSRSQEFNPYISTDSKPFNPSSYEQPEMPYGGDRGGS
jgi:hypothetical protein